MADKTTNYNLTKPSADDFYDVGVQNGNMDIVDAELKNLEDGKAPSGHGLGDIAKSHVNGNLLTMLEKGCGFYAVSGASDSPTGNTNWVNLLQLTKEFTEGEGTGSGVQIVVDSLPVSSNQGEIWMRTIFGGSAKKWNRLIHTGNIDNYANTRIVTGTYQGAGVYGEKNKNKLSFSFAPKLVIIQAVNAKDAIFLVLVNPATLANGQFYYGFTKNIVSWSENSVEWYCSARWSNSSGGTGSAMYQMNESGVTYTYTAIGLGGRNDENN